METNLIKEQIENFVNQYDCDYSNYYIGVTNNIDRRKNEHINKKWYTEGNPFIKLECLDLFQAKHIEEHFQEKGMGGYNPHSNIIENSKIIYCFQMTPEQKEDVSFFKIASTY